jgi:hypothetical protein
MRYGIASGRAELFKKEADRKLFNLPRLLVRNQTRRWPIELNQEQNIVDPLYSGR